MGKTLVHDTPISFSALKIEDLGLSVRLGCTAEERSRPQEVRVSLEFRFRDAPKGMITDELQDTICYAKVSETIKRYCESREFQLIERMAFDVYRLSREIIGSDIEIGVVVHKVRPPVESILGGTFFRCGDFTL